MKASSFLLALYFSGASAFVPNGFNRALVGSSTTALNGRGDKRTKKGKIARGSSGVSRPKKLKKESDESPSMVASAPAAAKVVQQTQAETPKRPEPPTMPEKEEEKKDTPKPGPVSIQEDVSAKMKVAMKAKDTITLSTIRSIKAALTNAEKETGVEGLSDEQSVAVLRKLAKQRQESIDMYKSAKSADGDERADKEAAELAVIETWLPSLADEATTRNWVEEAIAAAGDAPNSGKVMGALMKVHKGEIDGKLAQGILKELLA